MKNKYIVIDEKGKEIEPELFLKNKNIQKEFRIVVEKEAIKSEVILPSVIQKSKKNLIKVNEKAEYINIANKLGFKWEKNSKIGFISYNYKAELIMKLVKEYARMLVFSLNMPVYEVRGSNFFDMKYPVVDSYAKLFGDRLFYFENLVMSYDSSFPQFNLSSDKAFKVEKLPFAHFSIADCYRNEQNGECALLIRGKRFFMPDLHPYVINVKDAFEIYYLLQDKIIEGAKALKREYWNIIKVSSEENWLKYKKDIIRIVKSNKKPALVEIRRDGVDRYWIIDVDYSIVDKMEQVREISCIQIDVGSAKRVGIKYLDKNGKKHYPVIIHSAIPGGIERYIYMALDRFNEFFPFWLRPIQARLIPVGSDYNAYALEIANWANENINLRLDIDDRNESVSKRIKLALEELINENIVIGQREFNNPSFVKRKLRVLSKMNNNYPFLKLSWPIMVSKRIE